jgi:hypothetical protein
MDGFRYLKLLNIVIVTLGCHIASIHWFRSLNRWLRKVPIFKAQTLSHPAKGLTEHHWLSVFRFLIKILQLRAHERRRCPLSRSAIWMLAGYTFSWLSSWLLKIANILIVVTANFVRLSIFSSCACYTLASFFTLLQMLKRHSDLVIFFWCGGQKRSDPLFSRTLS